MATESLLEKFLSKANFLSAYRRIAAKKALGGLDGVSVEEFGRCLDRNISKLHVAIRERRYVPSPSSVMYVPKFNEENAWRELGLPTVADKIVQAALLQVVEPLAEKVFSDRSYAYRRGKGYNKAIRRIEHILSNRKKKWAVPRDIHNFFNTLNYDRLITQFSELVNGEPIMTELVGLWCRIGLVEKDGRWRNVQSGVRQGHVISPLLANLYLNPLDEFANNLKIEWVRYADNYLMLCDTQEEAFSFDGLIARFLRDELSLRLNNDMSAPCHIDEGFAFLGINFCGKNRTIEPRKVERMDRKIRWLFANKNNSTPEGIVSDLTETVHGWKRHYGFLNPTQLFSKIDKLIEDEFLNLVSLKIREGIWNSTPPSGLSFPSLTADDNNYNGLEKMQNLWKQAVNLLITRDVDCLKHKVDVKVARKRQKYRREYVHKGNLVVTTPGYFIGKRGERIVVRDRQRIIAELPVIQLRGLTISARGVALSGDVVELCMRNEIYIHFVDELGKITAVIDHPEGSSAELSLLQVTERNSEKGLVLAKMFVLGKVKNQLALLKYYHKYPVNHENGFGQAFDDSKPQMEHLISEISNLSPCSDSENFRVRLMGMEGAFGAYYWGTIKYLLNNGIIFEGRKRNGAKDLVNSALNYGYGILYSRVLNAVIKTGLNPMAGFLHCFQERKLALVYDIIEEFRAMVVDRSIFTMLRRGEKLVQEEDGFLSSETKKKIAMSVMKRLSSEVFSCSRRLTLDEVIQEQAIRVKKHLAGTSRYRPFLGRW